MFKAYTFFCLCCSRDMRLGAVTSCSLDSIHHCQTRTNRGIYMYVYRTGKKFGHAVGGFPIRWPCPMHLELVRHGTTLLLAVWSTLDAIVQPLRWY